MTIDQRTGGCWWEGQAPYITWALPRHHLISTFILRQIETAEQVHLSKGVVRSCFKNDYSEHFVENSLRRNE